MLLYLIKMIYCMFSSTYCLHAGQLFTVLHCMLTNHSRDRRSGHSIVPQKDRPASFFNAPSGRTGSPPKNEHLLLYWCIKNKLVQRHCSPMFGLGAASTQQPSRPANSNGNSNATNVCCNNYSNCKIVSFVSGSYTPSRNFAGSTIWALDFL